MFAEKKYLRNYVIGNDGRKAIEAIQKFIHEKYADNWSPEAFQEAIERAFIAGEQRILDNFVFGVEKDKEGETHKINVEFQRLID